MNNLAETEQERAYRKNKNAIVGMIMLNIFPVYAGKIHKVCQYTESWSDWYVQIIGSKNVNF